MKTLKRLSVLMLIMLMMMSVSVSFAAHKRKIVSDEKCIHDFFYLSHIDLYNHWGDDDMREVWDEFLKGSDELGLEEYSYPPHPKWYVDILYQESEHASCDRPEESENSKCSTNKLYPDRFITVEELADMMNAIDKKSVIDYDKSIKNHFKNYVQKYKILKREDFPKINEQMDNIADVNVTKRQIIDSLRAFLAYRDVNPDEFFYEENIKKLMSNHETGLFDENDYMTRAEACHFYISFKEYYLPKAIYWEKSQNFVTVENMCEWMERTPSEVLSLRKGKHRYEYRRLNGEQVFIDWHNYFAKYVLDYPILKFEDFPELATNTKFDDVYDYDRPLSLTQCSTIWADSDDLGYTTFKHDFGRVFDAIPNFVSSHNTPATKRQIIDGLKSFLEYVELNPYGFFNNDMPQRLMLSEKTGKFDENDYMTLAEGERFYKAFNEYYIKQVKSIKMPTYEEMENIDFWSYNEFVDYINSSDSSACGIIYDSDVDKFDKKTGKVKKEYEEFVDPDIVLQDLDYFDEKRGKIKEWNTKYFDKNTVLQSEQMFKKLTYLAKEYDGTVDIYFDKSDFYYEPSTVVVTPSITLRYYWSKYPEYIRDDPTLKLVKFFEIKFYGSKKYRTVKNGRDTYDGPRPYKLVDNENIKFLIWHSIDVYNDKIKEISVPIFTVLNELYGKDKAIKLMDKCYKDKAIHVHEI